MSNRALAMPAYISDMIEFSLSQIGLQSAAYDEDIRGCKLHYENGLTLQAIVMCTVKRRWRLFDVPVVTLSIVELENPMRVVKVHFIDEIAFPYRPNDLVFSVRLASILKASAWALAATLGAGECIGLGVRPGAH